MKNYVTDTDSRGGLSKEFLAAADKMKLTPKDAGVVIGLSKSSIYRGIDPESKAGELAKMLIRCYRSLYVLVGGKPDEMSHWMTTQNTHNRGIPAEQIRSVQGLVMVLTYLETIRR